MPAVAAAQSTWGDSSTTTVLIGKSLLGLALAFLLRAFTENQTLPVTLGVAIGIAYALGWLIWAARTPATETMTVALRALTSVLILIPLLWEALLRFHAISSWATAEVLTFFVVFGLGISWHKNLTAVAWVTSLAGLLSASALLIRSQDVLPFTCALLALALAVEASACLEHYLGERWVVAIVADLAVLLLTVAATSRGATSQGYVALDRSAVIAAQIALVLIYLSSTFVRTLGRGFQITHFEIGQCVLAFVISAFGAIRVAQGHPSAVLTVGFFCALCGVACYVVSLSFLDRHPEHNRNFHTYTVFGVALILAGGSLLLRGAPLAALWSALAVLCVAVGRYSGRITLKLHGALYLVAASLVSGSAALATRFVVSTPHPGSEIVGVGMWLSLLSSAAVCAVLLKSRWTEPGGALYRTVTLLSAAVAIWNFAGVTAVLLAPLCHAMSGAAGGADFCPTILTTILALLALGSVSLAQRWGRPEFNWLGYGLIAVATYKLVFQDLQQGQTFAIVLSLLIYGGALILLPRLARRSRLAAAL